MEYSNCCNAPIIENTDLCSQCFEHCRALTEADFEVDEFDEAMRVDNKKVIYNGKEIKDENK